MLIVVDSLVVLGSGVVVTVVPEVVVLVAAVVSVAAWVEVWAAEGGLVSAAAGVVVSVASLGVEFEPTEAVVDVPTGAANTVLDSELSDSSSSATLYTGNLGHSPSQLANTVEVWGSAA